MYNKEKRQILKGQLHVYYRYSKFETLLMALVSRLGSNVKIKDFETRSVTSVNVNKKLFLTFLKHEKNYKFYHLFHFQNQKCAVGGCSFLIKNCTIFITKLQSMVLYFCTYHKFMSLSRLRYKNHFHNNPKFRNNQQFKQ